MITGDQVAAQAQSHNGRYYYSTANQTRTTGTEGFLDCSGSVVLTLNQLGIWGVPTVSATQARWCEANHTDGLDLNVAYNTPGVLFFHGPNHGYDGWGNDGHVAIGIGNGMYCEAPGHSYPCTMDDAWPNRGWSNAAYVPGVHYPNFNPVPKPVPPKLPRVQHYVPPPYHPGHRLMSGDDILETQTRLVGWAFVTKNKAINPGKHDGIYGLKTAQSVSAFERAANIKVDAIVGPDCWNHLFAI